MNIEDFFASVHTTLGVNHQDLGGINYTIKSVDKLHEL
jgi:hypothetical protein